MKSRALAADTYPAEACRAKGVTSIKELTGLSLIQTQTVIDLLLCRSETVFLQDGSYSLAAQQFAVFVGLPEDMLFGEHPDAVQLRQEAEAGFVELYTAQPVDPEAEAIQESLKSGTTRVLAALTPREDRVLRMRFGIGMNTDHTLEEIGPSFEITRERIREIEAKALKKLKHPSRSLKLRAFLDGGMLDGESDPRKKRLNDLFDADPTACFDRNIELRAELWAWGIDRLEE